MAPKAIGRQPAPAAGRGKAQQFQGPGHLLTV